MMGPLFSPMHSCTCSFTGLCTVSTSHSPFHTCVKSTHRNTHAHAHEYSVVHKSVHARGVPHRLRYIHRHNAHARCVHTPPWHRQGIPRLADPQRPLVASPCMALDMSWSLCGALGSVIDPLCPSSSSVLSAPSSSTMQPEKAFQITRLQTLPRLPKWGNCPRRLPSPATPNPCSPPRTFLCKGSFCSQECPSLPSAPDSFHPPSSGTSQF